MFGQLIEEIRLEARNKQRQDMAQAAAGGDMKSWQARYKSKDMKAWRKSDRDKQVRTYRRNIRSRSPDPLQALAKRSEADRRRIRKAASKEGQRIRFKKSRLPR
jgi:hypothetical protein